MYEINQEIITYCALAYIIFVIAIFFIIRHKRKNAIKVRIKYPIERIKYVKPERDGHTLIIIKENKRKKIPEWKARFNEKSLQLYRKLLFGGIGFQIDIFPDAAKAIEYNRDVKETKQPKFDKKTSQQFIESEVIKNEGRGEKPPFPNIIIYAILIISMISLVLTFLIFNRFGLM